jgi:plasmid maintenance system antidote protein VapI
MPQSFNHRRFVRAIEAEVVRTSLRDLAQRSGIPHTTIYRIVEQRHKVKIDVALRLCNALGVDLTTFVDERGE